MPVLPSASSFTGSGVTEGDFKTQLTALRAYLSGLLGDAGTQAAAAAALGALLNGLSNKTAAYTVVAGDRGKLLDCTNTWTLAIDAAATLGAGFVFAVRNSGSGTITINPNLSEQIDGATTIVLAAGESCLVACDGTAFKTVGRTVNRADGQFQSMQVFTSSGTWTKPADLKRVKVTVVGGGAGGAAGNGVGAGGAGGAAIKTIEAGALGATETVTRGAGGAAATGGGTSSFGAHCSATGGGIPSGGMGSGGDINLRGAPGGPINTTVSELGAAGGSSIMGGGGNGGRGAGGGTGGDASNYGGGGGSGTTYTISGDTYYSSGGAGSGGIVLVEEFF